MAAVRSVLPHLLLLHKETLVDRSRLRYVAGTEMYYTGAVCNHICFKILVTDDTPEDITLSISMVSV